MMIRVLVADDQALVRAGFVALLDAQDGIAVVAEADTGTAALSAARELRPDVVLMDIRMPEMDGLEATAVITTEAPDARVLILTTFDLDEYVFQALRAGASGFLLKDTRPEELLAAVRVLAEGEALLAPQITRRLIEQFVQQPVATTAAPNRALETLTERELEVLGTVARGLSNAEIAAELFMSHATAKTHVSRLLTKLDARDRAQLVMLAYELGVATPGSG
jgi:DNA-binding NarL/FixJ family response regulator